MSRQIGVDRGESESLVGIYIPHSTFHARNAARKEGDGRKEREIRDTKKCRSLHFLMAEHKQAIRGSYARCLLIEKVRCGEWKQKKELERSRLTVGRRKIGGMEPIHVRACAITP